MLFAWAGTKGVSFGPTVWTGERGVLNQHIFKVDCRAGVDERWLYAALRHVTERIERKAHGFKSTLVHVKKSEIEQQPILLPPIAEQRKIADIFSTWDRAIECCENLLANAEAQQRSLMQQLLTGKSRLKPFVNRNWRVVRAHEVFRAVSRRRNEGMQLLAVTQDRGVIARADLDRRVVMPEGDISGYKLVVPGNFIISLRSFEGGLEYSSIAGLVSPAYHVLEPTSKIADNFYKHYFKSYNFIKSLSVATIGIRDGKQISYTDFSFVKIPSPDIDEQVRIGEILDKAERAVGCFSKQLENIKASKQKLMQELLTGKTRVTV